MRTIVIVSALAMAGCGDDTTSGNDMAMQQKQDMSMAQGDMAMQQQPDMSSQFPTPPTLGMQIDRMGRPAINTALTDPLGTGTAHGMVQDTYNQEADPTKWANFVPQIATSIAFFDGVDGVCGSQDATKAPLGFSNAAQGVNAYGVLASVVADDELYVNTATGTCDNKYLGVEIATATGMQLTDCGGRTPLADVIDFSYNALAGGAVPLTDGVNADGDGNPMNTGFPFLGAPN